MQQQVMFTACPKGRTANGLALSVLISPKLDPQSDPQLLSTFPDFLDWPSRVIQWQVVIGNAAPITAQVTSAPPQSSLWTGLFSANTLVRRPVHPDYTKHMWLSYPVGNVVDFIHDLYQDIAANHPSDFPSVEVSNVRTLDNIKAWSTVGSQTAGTAFALNAGDYRIGLNTDTTPLTPEALYLLNLPAGFDVRLYATSDAATPTLWFEAVAGQLVPMIPLPE